MTLLEGFQFTQSNLQDYLDCQRRFQLRYLLHVAWPSLTSRPASEAENYLRLGATFHYLIRQQLSGVPEELITASIHSTPQPGLEELLTWWENYLSSLANPKELGSVFPQRPQAQVKYFPEISLTTPLGGYRLIAKYDLLVNTPQSTITILDWKTSRSHPPRYWLQERMQSRIYPYIVVRAGKEFNQGISIQPEQIEMRYWFANFPGQIESFHYSAEQYLADETFLVDQIGQINQKGDADFLQTHNLERCTYCVYRSLCDRGKKAGIFNPLELKDHETDEESISIQLQNIDEVEF